VRLTEVARLAELWRFHALWHESQPLEALHGLTARMKQLAMPEIAELNSVELGSPDSRRRKCDSCDRRNCNS
jgi:hypothetical protein